MEVKNKIIDEGFVQAFNQLILSTVQSIIIISSNSVIRLLVDFITYVCVNFIKVKWADYENSWHRINSIKVWYFSTLSNLI